MEREYCKQDVFKCNTTGEILVFSCMMSNGISADFVNATDGIERQFVHLTYLGRNPNIVLVDDCLNNNGKYYVYGRGDLFKRDKKYRFYMKDEQDKSQSFKLFNDTTEHTFWARVISNAPFEELEDSLYNPFNCESPKKSMIYETEAYKVEHTNKTTQVEIKLPKLPKALI